MLRDYITSRIKSFKYAFDGWWCVLRTQRNAHIHALATICVIVLGSLLKLRSQDWAILVLTIGAVWTAECINTAIEATIDLVSPQKHPLAKIAKDAGAAAVLIAALCSIAIGFLVLGPPLWRQIISWLVY
jgi:diacylglycerol kinase